MDNRLEEFRAYLLDLERSASTIDSYLRSVKAYFKRFDEVNKKNMMEFKQWQLEERKPKMRFNERILRFYRASGIQSKKYKSPQQNHTGKCNNNRGI